MDFLHRSLKIKLLGLTTLTLAAAVFGLLLSVNIILVKSHRDATGASLKQTLFAVKGILQARLFEEEVQAKLIGEIPILSTVLEGGKASTIKDAAGAYRENLRVPVLDVLETNGTTVVSAGDPFLKDDTLPQAFLQKVLEEGAGRCIFVSSHGPILLGLSIIGNIDEPNGILLVGRPLDSAFAGLLKESAKTDVTIMRGDSVIASTLSAGAEWRTGGRPVGSDGNGQPLLHGKDYTTAFLSIEDYQGKPSDGVIALHHSLREQRQVLFSLRAMLLAVGGTLFLAASAAAYRFSNGITRPLAEAVEFAHNLAGGDTGKAIAKTRRDEIGTLQESLESMRVSLKSVLENLDGKIRQVTGMQKQVQNILDNLESGFLQFDSDGRIQPGYSKISEEFFGSELEGKLLEEVLKIEPEVWSSIVAWRDIMFGGTLPFKDAATLGPARFEKLEGRHIEIAYRPVMQDGALAGVIVVATDKTAEQELILRSQRERERADMIVKISVDRDGFLDFVRDTKSMLAQLQAMAAAPEGAISLEHLFRLLHTIKGNAAMYGLSDVRDIAHRLENELANVRSKIEAGIEGGLATLQPGLVALEDSLEAVLRDNKDILGERLMNHGEMRRVTVQSATLQRLEREMLTRFHRDSEMFRLFLDTFVLEPLAPAMRRYEAVAVSVAERRGKELKPIIWKGEDLRVRLQCYKSLIAALIHGFRNAVDHGIETPSEREEAGKDRAGQLMVEFSASSDQPRRLRIAITDDGRGIDPDIIRQLAVKRGMIGKTAAETMADNDVVQLVFRNGFSTSESVSDISGRGVGMDAILYEAKKLGGTAWLESVLGKGVKLKIEAPLYADADTESSPPVHALPADAKV